MYLSLGFKLLLDYVTGVINIISMGTVQITDNNSDGKDIDVQFAGALHVLSPNVYE